MTISGKRLDQAFLRGRLPYWVDGLRTSKGTLGYRDPNDFEYSALVPTLLFVDDEPNVLSVLRRVFRIRGYTILTACDGREALEILREQQPDLVITDMRMPVMGGYELLQEIQAHHPSVPSIVLTGYCELATGRDVVERGLARAIVSKPWRNEDLIAEVAKQLAMPVES